MATFLASFRQNQAVQEMFTFLSWPLRNRNSSSLKFSRWHQRAKGKKCNPRQIFPCIQYVKLRYRDSVLCKVKLVQRRVVHSVVSMTACCMTARRRFMRSCVSVKARSMRIWYCVVQSYASATAGCAEFCNGIQLQTRRFFLALILSFTLHKALTTSNQRSPYHSLNFFCNKVRTSSFPVFSPHVKRVYFFQHVFGIHH